MINYLKVNKEKMKLETIEDIQKAATNHNTVWPDTVYVRKRDNLLLFNYRPRVQYDNSWTNFELMCRGLVINQDTGEIVARAFDKFFNWGENNRTTNAQLINIAEKMDGSLGIHYRLKEKSLVTTRGNFESDQALWATEYLNKHHNVKNLHNNWTLLFEIIYPDNKVIVDYNGWSGLILLAIRNRFTGNYISNAIVKIIAKKYGFTLPKRYLFTKIDEIIMASKILPLDQEGWVAEFVDGQRFKFKGDEYTKICRLVNGMSFKWALRCHQAGILQRVKKSIPDEFYDELNEWINTIDNTIKITLEQIEVAYKTAPKTSRKKYAIWIQKHEQALIPYLFAKIDNKDILPLIYKLAFKGK
jgi:RNA ligase